MMNWLRTNKYASGLLLIIRLYLGYEWFIHGLEKVRGGAFDATGFLNNIIANPVKGPDGTAEEDRWQPLPHRSDPGFRWWRR